MALACNGRLQYGQELWSHRLQFRAMRNGELLQEFLSAESESQQHFATVLLAARTSDKTLGLKPVGQLNRAVMLNLETLGQHADRGNVVSGQAFYHQQCLMLVRLDAGSTRGVFAEVQEAADFVAEISERGIVDASLSTACLSHVDLHYIVLRYYLMEDLLRSFCVRR
jgi:hypothetical protein